MIGEPKPTVLLTGSRGFTGVYVRDLLVASGYHVVGVVKEAPSQDEICCDLEKPNSLQFALGGVRPDFVIHLAGLAFVGHSDPLDFYKVNLFGTLNLLQALHSCQIPPKKIIIASSSNVYGPQPISSLDEDCRPSPVNHYAMSKLSMEYLSHTWLEHLPIVIVRPFNYTGAGQSEKFLIPKIVNHYVRKSPTISLGNLEVTREFNDVRDVARAYLELLEAPSGTTVNICSGVGHKLLKIVQLVEELTGHVLKIEVDPKLVRASEVPVLIGDPAQMRRWVRFGPQYTLENTLEAMITYSRQHEGFASEI